MSRGLRSGDTKAVAYRLTPESGGYGRIGRFFREHEVWLVSVRDLDQLRDGSVVMQFEIAETPERLRARFGRDRDWVLDYQLAPGAQHPTLQRHCEPAGVTREMLELHRSHALLLDPPPSRPPIPSPNPCGSPRSVARRSSSSRSRRPASGST